MWAPRASVALPLPSSPHWAPISTTAGMALRLPERADVFGCGGTHGVSQELMAPLGLLRFTDRIGCFGQTQQRAQEALIRFVIHRNRSVSAPSCAAQRIQAAVVT